VEYGIAPQCARATPIVNMNRKVELRAKDPSRAQDCRGGNLEDWEKTEEMTQGGKKL
jgi:hypothetical protein